MNWTLGLKFSEILKNEEKEEEEEEEKEKEEEEVGTINDNWAETKPLYLVSLNSS